MLMLQDLFYKSRKSDNIFFQKLNLTHIHSKLSFQYALSQNFIKKQDVDDQQFDFNSSMPFNITNSTSIKKFIQDKIVMFVEISNINLIMNISGQPYKNQWGMTIKYEFQDRAVIKSSMQLDRQFVASSSSNSKDFKQIKIYQGDFNVIYEIVIFVFASVSLFGNLKFIILTINMYMQQRIINKFNNEYETRILYNDEQVDEDENENDPKCKGLRDIVESNKPWTSLSLAQKMLFIDKWILMSIATNIVLMWGSIFYSLQYYGVLNDNSEDQKSLIIGLGVFFSWINILKYTNYYQQLFSFTQILAKTLSGIANFFIAFMPIFIFFLIIGMTSFYRFQHFENTSQTISTLFGLMTADSICMITQDIDQKDYLNIFYIFSYVSIFFLAVHSIIVAIIVHKSKKSIIDKKRDRNDSTSVEKQQTPSKQYRRFKQLDTSQNQKSPNSKNKVMDSKRQSQKVSRYSSLLTNQDKGNFFGFITQKEQELQDKYYKTIQKIIRLSQQINQNIDSMQLLINDKFEGFYLKQFEKIGLMIKYKEFLRFVLTKLKFFNKTATRIDMQKCE